MTGFSPLKSTAPIGALLFALIFLPLSAASQTLTIATGEPPRTTVQAFSAAEGVEKGVARALESVFCTSLARQLPDDHEVICAGDVQALLIQKHAQMELGDCDKKEDICLLGLDGLSKGPRVVRAEVSRAGAVYVVSATVLDAESNKVLHRTNQRGRSLEKLLDAMEVLAKKVIEGR